MRLHTVAFISVALLAASPAFSRGFSGAEVTWATSLREREPMPAGGVLTANHRQPSPRRRHAEPQEGALGDSFEPAFNSVRGQQYLP